MTIKTNAQWESFRDVVLAKKGVCKIFVELDAKDLRGFAVNEPVRY